MREVRRPSSLLVALGLALGLPASADAAPSAARAAGTCSPSFRELGALLVHTDPADGRPYWRQPAIIPLIDRCEADADAAVKAGRPDAPRRLLEVARLFGALEAVHLRGTCDELEGYAKEHGQDFYVHTGHEGLAVCEYSGRQLKTIVERFPRAPEVTEARCRLAGLGFQDRGIFQPACKAFRAGLPNGRCDAAPPPGCEARLAAAEGCESSAFAAAEAEQPALFIAATRLFRSAAEACRAGGEDFTSAEARRPDVFDWGSRDYLDRHLQELEERGSTEKARDEGAWERAIRSTDGCGLPKDPLSMQCDTAGLTHFLDHHPGSPHVEEAVRLVAASVKRHLAVLRQGDKGDAQWQVWLGVMPTGAAPVLQLGRMVGTLPRPLAEEAMAAAVPFFERLGDHDDARGIRLTAERRFGRPAEAPR